MSSRVQRKSLYLELRANDGFAGELSGFSSGYAIQAETIK